MLNLWKIGPALAAGNTVVLKPAPDTPWSATMVGRLIAEETDMPPGVLNIVAARDPARSASCSRATRASTWSRSPARPRPASASCARGADG